MDTSWYVYVYHDTREIFMPSLPGNSIKIDEHPIAYDAFLEHARMEYEFYERTEYLIEWPDINDSLSQHNHAEFLEYLYSLVPQNELNSAVEFEELFI